MAFTPVPQSFWERAREYSKKMLGHADDLDFVPNVLVSPAGEAVLAQLARDEKYEKLVNTALERLQRDIDN